MHLKNPRTTKLSLNTPPFPYPPTSLPTKPTFSPSLSQVGDLGEYSSITKWITNQSHVFFPLLSEDINDLDNFISMKWYQHCLHARIRNNQLKLTIPRQTNSKGVSLVYKSSSFVQCIQQAAECKHSASGQSRTTLFTFCSLMYTLFNVTGFVD